MEGVLVLLVVTAVVMLFFARKAVNRAFTQSFELPPFRAKSDRLPPLSRGNPEGSAERREELRAKAKERVADLIQNPDKYGSKAKKKVPDEPITLVSAVPKSSKNQGIDTTFASYDDYMSMIESDFDVNPPIQNSDEDDSDDDGEDGEALDTALASDGEEDEGPIKKPKTPPSSGKKKGPSPRMTRSRAKLKSEGLEPPSKRRK